MNNRISKKAKVVVKRPKIGKRAVKSDFEWEAWKAIKNLLPKGASADYESEKLAYAIPQNYIPDFIVEFKDGRKMYIETKGYFPYPERAKMLSVREANPGLDVRMLFLRDSPSSLGRGSKTKPSEWATLHGFTWGVGEVPEDWFRDEQ